MTPTSIFTGRTGTVVSRERVWEARAMAAGETHAIGGVKTFDVTDVAAYNEAISWAVEQWPMLATATPTRYEDATSWPVGAVEFLLVEVTPQQ